MMRRGRRFRPAGIVVASAITVVAETPLVDTTASSAGDDQITHTVTPPTFYAGGIDELGAVTLTYLNYTGTDYDDVLAGPSGPITPEGPQSSPSFNRPGLTGGVEVWSMTTARIDGDAASESYGQPVAYTPT